MKRAAFLLFVILSLYIAGLYRYPPLLVLSMAALLSFPPLFFLSRYLKIEQQDMHIGEGTGKLFRADGMVRRSAGCLCEGGAVRLYPCSGGASSQTAGRYLTDCFRCFASAGI